MSAQHIPILFLDIDDVLCMSNPFGGRSVRMALDGHVSHPAEVLSQAFARDACSVLKDLHAAMNEQVRYVISSTWREHMSRDELSRVFTANDLKFVGDSLHSAWSTPGGPSSRTREADIWAWLDLIHAGEPFAILDDTFSGATLQHYLKYPHTAFLDRVVLCEENVGLQAKHLPRLLHALRTPLGPNWSEA